jgi:sperm-associated antigen 16 protein
MKKERDYHRMHHNRVAQEKNKLINDIKRLKNHYENYDSLLKTMKEKFDCALRDKVVNQLERDKVVAELKSFKQTNPAIVSMPSNWKRLTLVVCYLV